MKTTMLATILAAFTIGSAAHATPAPAASAPAAGTTSSPAGTSRTYRPAPRDTTGAAKPRTLREAYPDYHPGADDPELDAVKRGRRLVKPHRIAFEPGGASSLRGIIEQTVNAITIADGEALKRNAITRNDFVNVLWPEFPQSRPAANIGGDDAWGFVERKNLVSFNRTAGEYARSPIQLVSFKANTVRRYTNFRVYTDLTVTVKGPNGEPHPFTLIRSIVERQGRFKIYSTRD